MRSAYIYDPIKQLGYLYCPQSRLYQLVHRVMLAKMTNVQLVMRDLRPQMDKYPPGEIPVFPGLMRHLQTKSERDRNENDFMTYELILPPWRDDLVVAASRTLLLDLLSGQGPAVVLVRGDRSAWLTWVENWKPLRPLIEIGETKLYTEQYVRKINFERVSQARLVLVDIGTRTLRLADPRWVENLVVPVQYRGLVYCDHPEKYPDLPQLHLADLPIEADFLPWLLG